MTTPTTNYSWGKPVVGGDSNTWGTEANTIYDAIDALLGPLLTATGNRITPGGSNASLAAWTTNAIRAKFAGATYTDTSSSGTVATVYVDAHKAATLAASSATTYTNAYGCYFENPVAGTNATLTNTWALGADSLKVNGAANITGAATIGGAAAITGAITAGGMLLANRLYSHTQISPAANVTTGMAGIGSTLTLTPAQTGRLRVRIEGYSNNSTAGNESQLTVKYGTGTAPANNAAQTGTSLGSAVKGASEANAANVPFSVEREVTGLTVSTAYWFDLYLQASPLGSVTVVITAYRIEEF